MTKIKCLRNTKIITTEQRSSRIGDQTFTQISSSRRNEINRHSSVQEDGTWTGIPAAPGRPFAMVRFIQSILRVVWPTCTDQLYIIEVMAWRVTISPWIKTLNSKFWRVIIACIIIKI